MSSSSLSSGSGASDGQASDDADSDGETSAAGESAESEESEESGQAAAEEDSGEGSESEDSGGQASEAEESGGQASEAEESGGQASEAEESGGQAPESRSDDSKDVAAIWQVEGVLETRADHMARHIKPEDRKNCERCRYYAKERDGTVASKCCVVIGPLVKNWLMEHPDVERKRTPWRLGCAICFAISDGVKNDRYARCDVRKYRSNNCVKHSKSIKHLNALEKLLARVVNGRQEAAAGQAAASASSVGRKTRYACGISPAHVTTVLKMVNAVQSLRRFPKEMAAVRSLGSCDISPGCDSRLVARQLVTCMAAWEAYQTHELLRAASVIGLAQDAREPFLLIMSRSVLWKMPRSLRNFPVTGVRSLHWPNDGAPWIAERILGAEALGSDRTGPAMAQHTITVLKRATRTPESYDAIKAKVRSLAADNAADENVVKDELAKEFENLDFQVPDTTHSFQLGIKNGVKGDPIVDLVQGICVTNKKPHPSIANMLRNSKRFRKRFVESRSLRHSMGTEGWKERKERKGRKDGGPRVQVPKTPKTAQDRRAPTLNTASPKFIKQFVVGG